MENKEVFYLSREHEASAAHSLQSAHNVQRELLRVHTGHNQVRACLDVIWK